MLRPCTGLLGEECGSLGVECVGRWENSVCGSLGSECAGPWEEWSVWVTGRGVFGSLRGECLGR